MSIAYQPTMSLWQREVQSFFRQRNRVVSALVSPLLLWLLLGAGMHQSFAPGTSTSDSTAGSISYMQYFFPGSVSMILLFTAVFSMITVIEDRRAGFMQGVLVAPVPRLTIVLGKVLGAATIAMIHVLIFMLIWPLISVAAGSAGGWLMALGSLGVMLLMAVGLSCLGFCIAWPLDSTAGFHAIMMLVLMPMWFLSGSMFPLQGATSWMRVIMACNPLTYAQAVLSYLLSGGRIDTGAPLPLWACGLVSVVATVAIIALAVMLVNRPRKDGLA